MTKFEASKKEHFWTRPHVNFEKLLPFYSLLKPFSVMSLIFPEMDCDALLAEVFDHTDNCLEIVSNIVNLSDQKRALVSALIAILANGN